jgi:glucose-6-phosphate isomerase
MSASRTRCDRTPAWAALGSAYEMGGKTFDLREAFASDLRRFESFSQQAPHVFADLSKNLIDEKTQRLLLDLAAQCGLEAYRDAMFAGDAINSTENRAVMHFLLRFPALKEPLAQYNLAELATENIAKKLQDVQAVLESMLTYAEDIRTDEGITDIVNIGIGGSDLGPQMAVLALAEFATTGKRFHFVSNVDGQELAGVLAQCKSQSTLFLIASKTFTTAETMTNAHSARNWFQQAGGSDIARHFAALTTNVAAAADFGIQKTFGFWDWVGGRYSLWSAIGLPIALAIGATGFRELLAGAHAMDEHFRNAPLAQNLPVRMGLLDVWYRNFHRFTSRSIAPYDSALRRLPAYLQQLEMESNGKRVGADGVPLDVATCPVIWGDVGSNGQHAYFQLLHQGTDVIPVEFIAALKPSHGLAGHHQALLANCFAQSQAFMRGKTEAEVREELHAQGLPPERVNALAPHRMFPGNRPSNTILTQTLSPTTLGALIALYEHKVFVQGVIWNVNSFDQWGVELGKVLAKNIQTQLEGGAAAGDQDSSTAGLIARARFTAS